MDGKLLSWFILLDQREKFGSYPHRIVIIGLGLSDGFLKDQHKDFPLSHQAEAISGLELGQLPGWLLLKAFEVIGIGLRSLEQGIFQKSNSQTEKAVKEKLEKREDGVNKHF